LLNQTLTNSGLFVESVTYHLTPHANGCSGPVTDFPISVVQSPDVYFNPVAQTICSEQTSSIQVLSHVPGTSFTWTATGSSLLVTGYSSGTGPLIQQTITNSGTAIETVTYTSYPTVSGCAPGTPQSVILIVKPRPEITNTVTTFQQCSAVMTNIIPIATVPGSAYTWTATGSSPQVTGFSNNATPSLTINNLLVNSGFNTETVTYLVTPQVNGCSGLTVSFVVTVFPVPDVYFSPASRTICPWENSAITNNSHVTGTSFAWTASGSTPQASGFISGSGSWIQQVLNNTGTNIETVTYQVSPTANGCQGVTSNVVVTIDPAPLVSFATCHDPVVTTDAQPVKLRGGIPLNGIYSGIGVAGTSFFPAVAGIGTFSIDYIYTNQFGCKDTAVQSITVVSPGSFTCGSSLTDPRDNKTYATVQIGSQCWMADNLDYGSTITSSNMQRDNCIPEKYCYNDNPTNCSTSGGLYQWDEMMKFDNATAIQGLCPPAWHIPTETEWNFLFNQFISNGFAGSPLKFTGYSGFDALLSGIRGLNKSWSFDSFATIFWSSTSHGTNKAWAHGMNTYNPSVSFYPGSRNDAFSVRCLKD
jgi:uncharacterized protein (TIGR02145 family)